MAFHALLCVRDEEDIIRECLAHLLLWADHIHIFDTGSTDGTWDVIQELAASERRIIPHLYEKVWFNDAVTRAWLFEISRSSMKDGDWVGRVDADEFYHELPRDFIERQLSANETAIYHQSFDFCFTNLELQTWVDNVAMEVDYLTPIESKLRFYIIREHAEPRFFQYRSRMQWPSNASSPRQAGFVSRARIPVRHYPHRNPIQMHKKCVIRSTMIQDRSNSSVWQSASTHHWQAVDWRSLVVPNDSEGLRYWAHGATLPQKHLTNHLPSAPKRLLQRLIHTRLPLAALDLIRARSSPVQYPSPLDPATEARIAQRIREDCPAENTVSTLTFSAQD